MMLSIQVFILGSNFRRRANLEKNFFEILRKNEDMVSVVVAAFIL